MANTFQNSAAPLFMGEFCHALDGKNRLTIPADWRFAEETELYLLPSTSAKCLKVMPRAEVERIRNQADALPGPQRAAFLRQFGSQARQCTLDKSGRLSLPENFCRTLGLAGEVTLSGAIETFEIWSKENWSAARSATEDLAGSVLQSLGL